MDTGGLDNLVSCPVRLIVHADWATRPALIQRVPAGQNHKTTKPQPPFCIPKMLSTSAPLYSTATWAGKKIHFGSEMCIAEHSLVGDRRVLGYNPLQRATPKGEDRPVCPVA
jgi:hypothetical protein